MNNAVEAYPGQMKELEERVAMMEEIFRGERVVLPTSIEHAQAMITIAEHYIAMNRTEEAK